MIGFWLTVIIVLAITVHFINEYDLSRPLKQREEEQESE